MSDGKFDSDIAIIKQYWNSFISLLKDNLKELEVERKNIYLELKMLDHARLIINHSKDNIVFLLSKKEQIIKLDESLSKKITILEAFKKRNNLDNGVAIKIVDEIMSSPSIKNINIRLSELEKKLDEIDDELNEIYDLIDDVAFNIEIVGKYAKKFGLKDKALISVLSYAVFKTSKKEKISNYKKTKKTIESKEESVDVVVPNYEDQFEILKKQYEDIIDYNNELLNKYYSILKNMTLTEREYYKAYSLLSDKDLKDQNFEENYNEAMAKIITIKLFDAKDEVKNIMQNISLNDAEQIEYLEEYVKEFLSFVDKLKKIDEKIEKEKKRNHVVEDLKVFFLLDESSRPFISSEIREKGYEASLLNIIQKGQEGHIQQKKGSNIMPLRVNKKFKSESGKTVLAVRNYKIVVSYIKLNSGTGLNDGGIMILAASLLHPNTIQEDTDKIIKAHKNQIIKQINLLEKGEPQQLALQTVVRNEIMKEINSGEKENKSNGRNVK